ncbi:hypothetical protein PAXRUDRAFT_22936 [Paxillus rubicundulus Ve08.2h10]|uniref:Uncharacterized protein n=1 Tax=Paxillus rubicundulus Ve08.2h10 TaxID=930991 RepID=A0A0D0BJA5_9AGAM|nr:hypothetical protein PAXRUDRAFT_22936 [Paxillus rubicundulus Ve08.2h10]
MVVSKHLPLDFQFSGDPSHKEDPDDVFKFHHWIDKSADLQESLEGKNEADCSNEDSIKACSSAGTTEQPARGKGEGKKKEKGKVPA